MPKSDRVFETAPTPWALKGALGVGVLSVSSAAILIKLVPAPPTAIAFWRLALTVIILLPWAMRQSMEWTTVRKNIGWLLLSGVFLALHFLFWIRSLSLTSVAISTAVVSTHPVMVALWTRIIGRRVLRRRLYMGGALVFLGLTVATLTSGLQHNNLWGIFDALLGAVFAGGYLLLGQHLRQNFHTTHYAVLVYSISAFVLGSMQWTQFHHLGPFSPKIWALYVAMAVLPTLGGHTLFNWLLRYIPATEISLALLGEIAGASLLAWLILGQVPTGGNIFGVGLILGGLAITQWPSPIAHTQTPKVTP